MVKIIQIENYFNFDYTARQRIQGPRVEHVCPKAYGSLLKIKSRGEQVLRSSATSESQ